MAYVVLTCNDEEFLGTDPDPDPGYIRVYGYKKNPQVNRINICLVTHEDRQTNTGKNSQIDRQPDMQTDKKFKMHYPRTLLWE